jgi:hypothetical protein
VESDTQMASRKFEQLLMHYLTNGINAGYNSYSYKFEIFNYNRNFYWKNFGERRLGPVNRGTR